MISLLTMTDTQLLIGIMQNDDCVWRHVCSSLKPGFSKILDGAFPFAKLTSEDIDDIFQESLVILMQKVKSGGVTASREGAVFSYLVQIGKLTACNFIRKRSGLTSDEEVIVSRNLHKEVEDIEVPVEVKQQTQDEFLDRAYDSLPDTCKKIFKQYYWERKPFDDIADSIGYGTIDSVKTKKSKCMKQFKDFAKKLLDNDEFAEEVVRATVERAALRELINEERVYAETGVTMAALDIEDESDKSDK